MYGVLDRRQGAFFQGKDNDHLLERKILTADGFNGRLQDITAFFDDREYDQMINVFGCWRQDLAVSRVYPIDRRWILCEIR